MKYWNELHLQRWRVIEIDYFFIIEDSLNC